MRLPSIFILSGFLFVLSSCSSLIKEVDPEMLPKVEKKIVVQCYISPQDTLLRATVNLSQAVLGTNDYQIATNFKVVLSEGNRSIELKYNQPLFAYVADASQFPIEAGKTYRIRVDWEAEKQSVQAVCTVPQAVPLASIKLDSVQQVEGPGNARRWAYYIRSTWQDPANTANFYRLAGDCEFTMLSTNTSPNHPPTQNSQQMINQLIYDDTELVSDRSQDGQLLTSQRGYLYLNNYNFSYTSGGVVYTTKSEALRPFDINVYLLHVDQNYYAYHRALELQNDAGDNPFAEPVLIPGNIEGGLGCFAAYNRSTLTVTLK